MALSKTVADTLPETFVAEVIDLARSAHVYVELIGDRLTVRAVDPIWEMWRPVRYLLDEIGIERITSHLRAAREQEATSGWSTVRH